MRYAWLVSVSAHTLPASVKDAGNRVFASGARMRAGVVFRISGNLASDQDLALLNAAAITTVVDLRNELEIRSGLVEWARTHGIRYEHHPIFGAGMQEIAQLAVSAPDLAAGRAQQARLYIKMVDVYGPQIARTIALLADDGPVGFGCAAGKDRTGVVTAVLHVLVGASVPEAAAAYAAQAPSVEQLRPMAYAHFGIAEGSDLPPGIEALLGVDENAILAVFAHLGEAYGGVEPWLAASGLPAGALERLRVKLLET